MMAALPLAVAFSHPQQLWWLLGLLPLILLFLMKRRRRKQEVGSVMLWQALLKEDVVQSPFRVPREWLSLLLLVLALLGLGLALGGLRWGSVRQPGSLTVLVMDGGATMATREGDRTRFEVARGLAQDELEGAGDDVGVVVILAGAEPILLGDSREDPALLRRRLADAKPEPRSSDLLQAVDRALALLAEGRKGGAVATELRLVSDFAGGAPDLTALDTGGVDVKLVALGDPHPNRGIVGVFLGGSGVTKRLVVHVAANDLASGEVIVSLYRDDVLQAAREVELAAGDSKTVLFPIELEDGAEASRFRLRLSGEDALALDDEVVFGIARAPSPRILVLGEASPYLDALGRVFPGLEVVRVSSEAKLPSGTSSFDLLITTQDWTGEEPPPARRILWWGAAPAGLRPKGEALQTIVVGVERGDPVLRQVDLGDLVVLRQRRLEPPGSARVLVRTDAGPQFFAFSRQGREHFVWASRPADCNLALLPAFPLLIRNLLADRLRGLEPWSFQAGEPVRFPAGLGRLLGEVDLHVTGPDGMDVRRSLEGGALWVLGERPRLGAYTAEATKDGRRVVRPFGVGLLNGRITRSQPAAAPSLEALARTTPHVALERAGATTDGRPLWRPLILLAFLLLTAEALWAHLRH